MSATASPRPILVRNICPSSRELHVQLNRTVEVARQAHPKLELSWVNVDGSNVRNANLGSGTIPPGCVCYSTWTTRTAPPCGIAMAAHRYRHDLSHSMLGRTATKRVPLSER